MRRLIRSAAELMVCATAAPALARRWRNGILVLAYHNIVPDGTAPFGDRSLHLTVGRFERQMRQLARTHEIVPLDRLLEPRGADRPRAAVTFDDAYAGALQLALPVLQRLGIPCTLFVAPGLLGLEAPWWDRLSDPVRGLDPATRTHALVTLAGRHDAVVEWAHAAGLPLAPPAEYGRIATADELLEALRAPAVAAALHTWGHPNLAALDASETEDELRRSLQWLTAHGVATQPWLAYPYGLAGPAAMEASRNAGMKLGFRVAGGWTPAQPSDLLELPRLNVPSGLSDRGFLLRTSGVVGG